jgi:hypothetical protein
MSAISDHDSEHLFLDLHALTVIVQILTNSTELPNLLNSLVKKITDAIMLWQVSTGNLRAHAMFGYGPESLKRIGFQTGVH